MGKLEKGRCGLCCSLVVRISEDDIKRIERLEYKRDFFVEKIANGDNALKRINDYCRFLVIKDGIAGCTIYEQRPKVCRDFVCIEPGMDDCKLKRHYNIVDITKV